MSTSVHGETRIREHCLFAWQEGLLDERRLYAVGPNHCLQCLTAILSSWRHADFAWVDRHEGERGVRTVGGHCSFRWEVTSDTLVRGEPSRVYLIEPLHCSGCISVLTKVCRTESGATLTLVRSAAEPAAAQ